MRTTITGCHTSDPASFVGRKRELSVLGEQLKVARTGHSQVVVVEAAPGAGNRPSSPTWSTRSPMPVGRAPPFLKWERSSPQRSAQQESPKVRASLMARRAQVSRWQRKKQRRQ
jgi:hypothetical protein